MRVIHIIPTAFDYFDDIKKHAFKLVEEINEYANFEAEALTLQYSGITKTEQTTVKYYAPHQKYLGSQTLNEAVDYLNTFEVVHLHTPFLGAGQMLWRWRQNNPKKILVVSVYRSVPIVDLISVGIRWYNKYYLKRLKSLADIVLEGENVMALSTEEILSVYDELV
ncbi:MAG: hypothetical protein Q7S24_00075 [bacterium]|nr:hypothetical protein [bacterium]